MELIDKRGKINKVTFKQIVKEANTAKLGIEYGSSSVIVNPETLLLDLFLLDIPDDKDFDVKISNGMDDKVYVFTGKDFNWFLKADRLKDLSNYVYGFDIFSLDDDELKAAQEETKKRIVTVKPSKQLDTRTYHIAVVSTKDEEDPNIKDYTGLKIDCIKWLNQQIVQNANLDNEVEILICLDYDAEEPNWKSLKELFEEGKIDIC